MQETILQSIGRTPLIRLRRLAEGLKARVYVKAEMLNPGGSIKDRVGVAMIAEAEKRGWLRPGGTIIEATAGNTGVGTGGSVSGIARYLKERNPDVRIVGADPEGSVLSGGSPKAWKVEGIGEDFVPKTFNSMLVDDWVRVSDAESFHTARELARREGILVGGSSGTAVAAALRYAKRLEGDPFVVAICPDTGRNYLSKLFDDEWLAKNHLEWTEQPARTVGDLLRLRGPRQLVTISPDATAAEATRLMQATGISQLPVLQDGKNVGSIQEVTLARLLHDNKDLRQVIVGEVMARPLPQLDVATDLDEVYRLLLSGNTGALAVEDGKVVGIVTRIDLIQYWTQSREK